MPDYLSNEDCNPAGTDPMPSPEFCEEFLHNLSEFIRDEYRKSSPLDAESPVSSGARRSFVARINQYASEYVSVLSEYGFMLRRYRMQDPNHDLFALLGASHVASNPAAYPPPYSELNQSSSAAPGGINVTQQSQSATRTFEPSNPSLVHLAEPASTGSGNHVAGSGAASIGSYLESTSRRRNREPSHPNENSTTTPGSHRSKRVDTQTRKDKKPEKKHECKKCGKKFLSPAHLKSHNQIASHSPRGYRCKFCGTEFTREFSKKRHNTRPTPACMAARRAGGASNLGSGSGVQSVSHVSAGGPSRTPYNAQDNMALSDGSTGPFPGNQQRPLVPKFHPPSRSPTNPPTTRSRNRPSQAAHTPPRPQPVTTAQSPPSRRPLVRALYPSSPANPWNTNGHNCPSRTAHSQLPPGAASGSRQRLPVPPFCPPTPISPPSTSRLNFSLLAAYAPSQPHGETIAQSPPGPMPTGGSRHPAPGNLLPLVLGPYPTSPTNPRTASRRNSAHVPSQQQDVAITQLPPGSPYGSIGPIVLNDPAGYLSYGRFLSP